MLVFPLLVAVGVGAIAAAVTGVMYQRFGAWRDAQQFPPPGRLVDIEGHQLHVVVRGQGEPCVWFESAIAGSSLSWSRVQPAVANFTTACTYDRAGLGWSDPTAAPLTLSQVVADLRALIDRSECTTTPLLVGHSFGAFVCLAFASAHPREVRGLVLVDPPTDWIGMDRRRLYLIRGARQLSRLGQQLARLGVVRASLALLTGGAPAAPRYFVKLFGPSTAHALERFVGEVRKLPPEVHPLVQAAWCQPKCFRAMAEYLDVFEEVAQSASQHRLPEGMPAIVISASDQPEEVKAAHEALARSTSRGRHIVASRGGHWVPFDEPGLIVDAIRELVGWPP